MLVGIVMRGAAFVFRAYGPRGGRPERLYGRVFSIASVLTPFALGVTLGAVVRGGVRLVGGVPEGGFVAPWLAPFPIALGVLVVALFAFLAAVYLTLEVDDDVDDHAAVREDFRRRALGAALALAAAAWAALAVAARDAPRVWHALAGGPWSLAHHVATGLVALGAIAALWTRRYRLARALAAAQAALLVAGLALAQYPYVLPPALTIEDAAAPASVLAPLLVVLAAGGALVLPAFVYLYRVFKRRRRSGGAAAA